MKTPAIVLSTLTIITIAPAAIYFATRHQPDQIKTPPAVVIVPVQTEQPIKQIAPAFKSLDSQACGYRAKPTIIKINDTFTLYESTALGTICFHGSVVPGADAATFKPFFAWFAKDKSRVYIQNRPIESLDPESIARLSNNWLVDKNNVWYLKSNSVELVAHPEASTSTFKILGGAYATDGKVVYFNDSNIHADSETFKVLTGTSSRLYAYAKDKNYTYYGGSQITDADVASFSYLGSGYGKDDTSLYYDGKAIEGGDPVKARLTGDTLTDGVNIYTNGVKSFAQYDAETFRNIAYGYISDANGVWYHGLDYTEEFHKIDGADPSTFTLVDTCSSVEKSQARYFKDKNHVYSEYSSLPDIDPKSFVFFGNYDANPGGMPVSSSYAKDKNNVYVDCGTILKDANPATFKIIKDGYAMDDKHIWDSGHILTGGDRARCVAGETDSCGTSKIPVTE